MKRKKNSSGVRRRAYHVAAEGLRFDIVVYLAEKGAERKMLVWNTVEVHACEEDRLDVIKALVKGHDVDMTNVSMDEMASKTGKDSNGDSCI